MADTLNDEAWGLLLHRIARGRCLPLLGAGASAGALPLGGDIARDWAKEYGYPLADPGDLPRVAQYLALKFDDGLYPKETLLSLIKERPAPDFSAPDEPHGVLASLPLPIYMTTNYDDFMFRALKETRLNGTGQCKQPVRRLCHWNESVPKDLSALEPDYVPTVEKPLVFHMHGSDESVNSLVLTEDDYLSFLVKMTMDTHLLPSRLQEAFRDTSLLFVGYALADWNFRVLFRALVEHQYFIRSTSRAHVSVQLLPVSESMTDQEKENARVYLDKYFRNSKIHVFWGSCNEFVSELSKRWKAYVEKHPKA